MRDVSKWYELYADKLVWFATKCTTPFKLKGRLQPPMKLRSQGDAWFLVHEVFTTIIKRNKVGKLDKVQYPLAYLQRMIYTEYKRRRRQKRKTPNVIPLANFVSNGYWFSNPAFDVKTYTTPEGLFAGGGEVARRKGYATKRIVHEVFMGDNWFTLSPLERMSRAEEREFNRLYRREIFKLVRQTVKRLPIEQRLLINLVWFGEKDYPKGKKLWYANHIRRSIEKIIYSRVTYISKKTYFKTKRSRDEWGGDRKQWILGEPIAIKQMSIAGAGREIGLQQSQAYKLYDKAVQSLRDNLKVLARTICVAPRVVGISRSRQRERLFNQIEWQLAEMKIKPEIHTKINWTTDDYRKWPCGLPCPVEQIALFLSGRKVILAR